MAFCFPRNAFLDVVVRRDAADSNPQARFGKLAQSSEAPARNKKPRNRERWRGREIAILEARRQARQKYFVTNPA
jgi:hypothetical protein